MRYTTSPPAAPRWMRRWMARRDRRGGPACPVRRGRPERPSRHGRRRGCRSFRQRAAGCLAALAFGFVAELRRSRTVSSRPPDRAAGCRSPGCCSAGCRAASSMTSPPPSRCTGLSPAEHRQHRIRHGCGRSPMRVKARPLEAWPRRRSRRRARPGSPPLASVFVFDAGRAAAGVCRSSVSAPPGDACSGPVSACLCRVSESKR